MSDTDYKLPDPPNGLKWKITSTYSNSGITIATLCLVDGENNLYETPIEFRYLNNVKDSYKNELKKSIYNTAAYIIDVHNKNSIHREVIERFSSLNDLELGSKWN